MGENKILLVSTSKQTKDLFKKIIDFDTLLVTSEIHTALHTMLRETIPLVIIDWDSSWNEKVNNLQRLQSFNNFSELLFITSTLNSPNILTLNGLNIFNVCTLEINENKLKQIIKNLINRNLLKTENKKLLERIETRYSWGDFVGRGNYYNLIISKIEDFCRTKDPILIIGEEGTEKEIIAYEIYKNSPWSTGNFIKKNITSNSLEDISFIYKAYNGCLVLDDISALSLEGQKQLKGLLAEHITAMRCILFSKKPLEPLVKKGMFDDELYHQLAPFELLLVPLRERIKDLPDIIENYLTIINETNNFSIKGITDEALLLLTHYSWPGNLAQLRTVLSLICYRKKAGEIELKDLPLSIQGEEKSEVYKHFESYCSKKSS